jgi:hypothetical protein
MVDLQGFKVEETLLLVGLLHPLVPVVVQLHHVVSTEVVTGTQISIKQKQIVSRFIML